MNECEFAPPETKTHREAALLRSVVDATWIFGHVETWDAERASGARERQDRVEHGGRCLGRVLAVAPRGEPDRVLADKPPQPGW